MLLLLTITAAALISGHAAVMTALMPLIGIGTVADQFLVEQPQDQSQEPAVRPLARSARRRPPPPPQGRGGHRLGAAPAVPGRRARSGRVGRSGAGKPAVVSRVPLTAIKTTVTDGTVFRLTNHGQTVLGSQRPRRSRVVVVEVTASSFYVTGIDPESGGPDLGIDPGRIKWPRAAQVDMEPGTGIIRLYKGDDSKGQEALWLTLEPLRRDPPGPRELSDKQAFGRARRVHVESWLAAGADHRPGRCSPPYRPGGRRLSGSPPHLA